MYECLSTVFKAKKKCFTVFTTVIKGFFGARKMKKWRNWKMKEIIKNFYFLLLLFALVPCFHRTWVESVCPKIDMSLGFV